MALGGAPHGKGMNPSMLPALFSSSWDAFVLGRAGWIFLWANGFALSYLFPFLVVDDIMLGIVADLWSRLDSKAMAMDGSTARLCCACGGSDGVEKAQLHLADLIATEGLVVVCPDSIATEGSMVVSFGVNWSKRKLIISNGRLNSN